MLKVMLIDDEAHALAGLKLLLDWENHGAQICGLFQMPLQALEAAKALQPDLIITDIEMPEISGLDLIVSLKSVCPGATCVILSAYSDFQYAQRAMELGVYRYLLKPLENDTLAGLLEDVAAMRRAALLPRDQDFLRSLMIREILANGTAFSHASTLPFYQELFRQKNLLLAFLRPKQKDRSMAEDQASLQAALGAAAIFQEPEELVAMMESGREPILPSPWDQRYAMEVSEPFVGLEAGHQLLKNRREKQDPPAPAEEESALLYGGVQNAAQKAMAYIQDHYTEVNFRLADIADAMYVNYSYLSYTFHQQTGTTLSQYLLDLRMGKAAELLKNSDLPVAEIGCRVGYSIPKNFYTAFKKYYRESPRSYQKKAQASKPQLP